MSARRLFSVVIGLLAVFTCGQVQGQENHAGHGAFQPASAVTPASARASAPVAANALARGALYRLSASTPIVVDPDPCHEVTEHPAPLPSGIAVRVSRASVFEGILWYEVRTADGGSVLGWINANVLGPVGAIAIAVS
jgi:hypothetical protein